MFEDRLGFASATVLLGAALIGWMATHELLRELEAEGRGR